MTLFACVGDLGTWSVRPLIIRQWILSLSRSPSSRRHLSSLARIACPPGLPFPLVPGREFGSLQPVRDRMPGPGLTQLLFRTPQEFVWFWGRAKRRLGLILEMKQSHIHEEAEWDWALGKLTFKGTGVWVAGVCQVYCHSFLCAVPVSYSPLLSD